MPAEVANILRRSVLSGKLTADAATLAHEDLLRLPVELFGYQPFGRRVWELRATVTAYDAWYVALSEALDLPFATLDSRLATASGPTCTFLQPTAAKKSQGD
jgi:predicted nucleic acid-binding protein